MTPPNRPLRLHRLDLSGHCHRVEALLSILGLPYELIQVDLLSGAHKEPGFLARNPFGQVPVLEDGELTLADSNAILVYLASRYDDGRTWYPADPAGAARVQRWLSVAAGELAAGPAAARVARLFRKDVDLTAAHATAHGLFSLMNTHLTSEAFLAASSPTIADLALYAYTARADEGGISLEAHAHVQAWLRRVEGLPRFVPMKRAGAVA